MGNRFVYEEFEDPPGPGEGVGFFQNLHIKWMKTFINRVVDYKRHDIDLNDEEEVLKWTEYFRIFSEIRETLRIEAEGVHRKTWHPAVAPYSMRPYEEVPYEEEIPPPPVVKLIEDDYTDDSASEGSKDENAEKDEPVDGEEEVVADSSSSADSSYSSKKRPVVSVKEVLPENQMRNKDPNKRNWDSTFISPIYFGYNYVKQIEYDKQKAAEVSAVRAREARAIEKARSARGSTIDTSERMSKMQEEARQKKIDALEAKYNAAKAKLEAELETNRRDLPAAAFTSFKVSILVTSCSYINSSGT